MQTNIAFCLSLILVCLSNINAITVSQENFTENETLNDFLCNHIALNTTIEIHFLSGQYCFMHQPSCLLQNKASIKITGDSSDNTTIECQEPFNIAFMGINNVLISNIKMVNCGNVASEQMVYNITKPDAYFGNNYRFAVMFYQVKNITITKFTMQNTLGYGIIALSTVGNITLSKINIENTTFNNDPKCNNYDYNNDTADFICSGSGIFIIYHENNTKSYPVNETNAILTIDKSNFTANRNLLPHKNFSVLKDILDTGFYETSIPLQGAAGITIFYLQNSYCVNAAITNSWFHNNNGTLSASIAIGSLSTIRGITLIKDCRFDDNNRINRSSGISSHKGFFSGGIIYLSLVNRARIYNNTSNCTHSNMTKILSVEQCNFTKLGGILGAAIHIEKISAGTTPLVIKIHHCNFTENEANMGSAVYTINRKLDSTLSNSLIIKLSNVNANNNALMPGITVRDGLTTFVTGIFHSENCHFKFDCSMHCNFSYNQPSVFYGHSALLTLSGKIRFFNNTSSYGGALNLFNTVMLIHQDSKIYFANNYALIHGGAVNLYFFNTNAQSQDTCPIQFTGSNPIFYPEDLDNITVKFSVVFENNTAGPLSKLKLQSIFASVFYVCTWYSYTLTQVYLGKSAPIINGTRKSVYRKLLSFIPKNTANEHLSILAYLPCPCDKNNTYDADKCMRDDLNDALQLETAVVIGRSFTISLMTLDVVGSIGHSSYLNSRVSSFENVLTLPYEQLHRQFSITNNNCMTINFTIYAQQNQSKLPKTGILHLSFPRSTDHNFNFSIDECPIGFSLQNVDGLYACTCGEFFNKSPIKEDFQCDTVSGKIRRIDIRSWLSVISDSLRVEYTRLCLPEYCNNIVSEFSPTDLGVLCNRHHTGRACSRCDDGYSKTFGSKVCRKCCNVWLVTILLYGILGILLVLIIHLLKLTVTMGTINGLIFFCNIMSINEGLFFNVSKFYFVRLFVSLINLDLGFEICFYKEMTEIAKTGLQFVFPLYLWLLMFIITMVGKRYMRNSKSTRSAVPVLATLIFLSYSKLLRTTISVFTSVTVYYSTEESNFSRSKWFVAWQPDPNIKYLEGRHIALFLVALMFTLFFILPLAFAFTFPKIVLRSKNLSRFFPLFDCIYAPYKNHCRFWFGVRIIVLIYYSGMESVLSSRQDSLLLSGVIVIFLFTLLQACIHPFKSTMINTLDLMFMGIFLMLSIATLYLYPNSPGHKEFIAVNFLGGIAFLLFCFIIIFHLHDALMHFTWYSLGIETLQTKFHIKKLNEIWNHMGYFDTGTPSHKPEQRSSQNLNESLHNYNYLQESLLEEQFN